MTLKRYFRVGGLSRPRRRLWRGCWALGTWLGIIAWLGSFGCGGGPCVPACGAGYQCVYGQCQLKPEGGREQAITCQAYCNQLAACNRTTASVCIASQCRALSQFDTADRQFRLSLYECHLAATCNDIKEYLEFQRGFLQSCVGCSRDLHCPGGFKCNLTGGVCRNSCAADGDCRSTHQCLNQRCEARTP